MTDIIRRARPERIEKGLYWDEAWGLVQGCSYVSEGCFGCWSAEQTHMRSFQKNEKVRARYGGLTDEAGRWNGEVRLIWDDLDKPRGFKQPTVFAVWNDLFHPDVPDGFIERVLETAADYPMHTFLVLTKRAARLYEASGFCSGFPDNVWAGVSVENQDEMWRASFLMQSDVKVRYISYEPALGPLSIRPPEFEWLKPTPDWLIVGGESGPGARPMDHDWVRSTRDQAKAAGAAFFFKQWGDANPGPVKEGTKHPLLDGRTWTEFPEAS